MGENLRRFKRLKWNREGEILSLVGKRIATCLVKDISTNGARLEVRTAEKLPDCFRLDYGGDEQPKCSVQRQRNGRSVLAQAAAACAAVERRNLAGAGGISRLAPLIVVPSCGRGRPSGGCCSRSHQQPVDQFGSGAKGDCDCECQHGVSGKTRQALCQAPIIHSHEALALGRFFMGLHGALRCWRTGEGRGLPARMTTPATHGSPPRSVTVWHREPSRGATAFDAPPAFS
jgi:hypothetical protein